MTDTEMTVDTSTKIESLDADVEMSEEKVEEKVEEKAPAPEEEGGLDDDDETEIELVSKEGKKIKLRAKYAKISQLIKTTLSQDEDAKEITIIGVSTKILEKVLEYMNHHEGKEPEIIPKPLRSNEMKTVCSNEWDAKFIDTNGENRQDLYDLILAANYMDIKGLLHLGCAKVASMIKGQPLEKIKDILSPQTSKKSKE